MMIFELIILLLAIPVGILIAFLAKDELIAGRKYFKAIIIASILSTIWFFLTKHNPSAYTSLFILITTFISYRKSFDKKWTKRKL
jgi:hypothetical protein